MNMQEGGTQVHNAGIHGERGIYFGSAKPVKWENFQMKGFSNIEEPQMKNVNPVFEYKILFPLKQ